ncbi:hypothetical protein P280DRAFT_522889 [Massarina eburnea CBS 473.64]|uniref:Ankyrin n=1 Tax=Massarina eburnea CBS 473.64 TaxID=1395130 RepID=A0A6A6RKD9_9PLEO|nr:hypothetical protein P280DRAFT_522889 [Massarina eburnea CBS 473.64]
MDNLLDLPLEVLRMIINELVLDIGIRNAWKKRNTCRTFLSEIDHNILAVQSISLHKRHYYHGNCLTGKVWLMLFYRSKMLGDANPMFPDKVNQVLKWLEEELNTMDEAKDDLREAVCKIFVGASGLERMYQFLTLEYRIPSDVEYDLGKELCGWDKLAIATALGNMDLVKKELPLCVGGRRCGNHMGDVLYHALQQPNLDILQVVSDYVEDLQSSEKLVFEERYEGSLFNQAMQYAISQNNLIAINDLLMLRAKWTTKLVDKYFYYLWMEMAVRKNDVLIVRRLRLVEFFPIGPRVTLRAFKYACKYCSIHIIKELLGDGGLDPSYNWGSSTPLILAIKCRDVEKVRTVIDAGAYVHGSWRGARSMDPLVCTQFSPQITGLLLKKLEHQKGARERMAIKQAREAAES